MTNRTYFPNASLHLLSATLECLSKHYELCAPFFRLLLYQIRQGCSPPCLSDWRSLRIYFVPGVVPYLSLQSRNNTFSRNWFVEADLFHHSYQSHDPRHRYCASSNHHLLPSLSDGFCQTSKNCPHHPAALVIRFNNRCNRLPYALPNLSLLSE